MTIRSPSIGFIELESSQTNKYITINDALLKLVSATQAKLSVTSNLSTIVLSDDQSTSYGFYDINGASGDFTLEFAATVYSAIQCERVCAVWNNTAYKMTLHIVGGGNTVAVPAYSRIVIHLGTDTKIRVISTNTFDIEAFWRGTISGVDQQMIRYVATRPFTLPAGMVGTRVSCGTNPAGTVVFNVKQNGGAAGTISITSGGVVTFSLVGHWPFAIGDVLTITTPNPNDATIADIAINLRVLHQEPTL